jgi:hypothetical protein
MRSRKSVISVADQAAGTKNLTPASLPAVEFEVMIRPIKALAAPGEEIGNRISR